MDGLNSEESKQGNADMSIFVQSLLNKCYFSIIVKRNSKALDEMGIRINELEQSINDLKAEMGVEGYPSPLAPSKV